MRTSLILLPFAVLASPAFAEQPTGDAQFQLPPELTDPAFADRMARSMDALSKIFLDLKVGELQAATEGREATPAEKKMTIREVGKIDSKDFERRMAEVRPQLQQSMKALQQAMPELMKSLAQVQQSLERAAANLPDPNYPKR